MSRRHVLALAISLAAVLLAQPALAAGTAPGDPTSVLTFTRTDSMTAPVPERDALRLAAQPGVSFCSDAGCIQCAELNLDSTVSANGRTAGEATATLSRISEAGCSRPIEMNLAPGSKDITFRDTPSGPVVELPDTLQLIVPDPGPIPGPGGICIYQASSVTGTVDLLAGAIVVNGEFDVEDGPCLASQSFSGTFSLEDLSQPGDSRVTVN